MRDDFSQAVKRTIADRVGNECSNPDCRALTCGPQDDVSKALNVGVAAHITAASAGGPRYDFALSAEQRTHPENAIWLCQNCAKLVDNDPVQFSADLLRAWKQLAECRALQSIGKTRKPEQPLPESEAQRKARHILEWKGQRITLKQMNTGRAVALLGPVRGVGEVIVRNCTEFCVTVGGTVTGSGEWSRDIPLVNIVVSFDTQQNRLELYEKYD